MDRQQGFTVQHRELVAISWDKPYRKGTVRKEYACVQPSHLAIQLKSANTVNQLYLNFKIKNKTIKSSDNTNLKKKKKESQFNIYTLSPRYLWSYPSCLIHPLLLGPGLSHLLPPCRDLAESFLASSTATRQVALAEPWLSNDAKVEPCFSCENPFKHMQSLKPF